MGYTVGRVADTATASALHAQLADQVLDAVRDLHDPAARHQAIGDILIENSAFISQLAELLRESVRAMKDDDGMSYAQIAAALGVSRGRAQQLYNSR